MVPAFAGLFDLSAGPTGRHITWRLEAPAILMLPVKNSLNFTAKSTIFQ